MIKKVHFRAMMLLISSFLLLQSESEAMHSLGLTPKFGQYKEGVNNGLLFDGPQFFFDYRYSDLTDEDALEYEARFGGGVCFSKGILGIDVNFKPLDLFYGFKIENDDYELFLGPKALIDYNFQIYPDLQIGNPFWFSNFSLSPQALMIFPHGDNIVKLKLSNSLLGLISRPDERISPYFYSLDLADLFSDFHSNMKFGTLNLFTDTRFSGEYIFGQSRWSVAYNFQYFNYFDDPGIVFLSHGISVRYFFGGHNYEK